MKTLEIIKLILLFIGAATVIMSIALTLLYVCFYRHVTIEELARERQRELKKEMEEEPGTLTIDQLVN